MRSAGPSTRMAASAKRSACCACVARHEPGRLVARTEHLRELITVETGIRDTMPAGRRRK